MRLAFAAALLALLLAGPAGARLWTDQEDNCSGTQTGAGKDRIPVGKVLFWCPTDGVDSPPIWAEHKASCNWEGDTSGAAAGTVTLDLYACSGGSRANECSKLNPTAITAGTADAYFEIAGGTYGYILDPSGSAANGRLTCRGY